MSNRYDAILYDLDGTLTDSIPLIMKCFHLAYIEVLGECTRTDEDLMSYIGQPLLKTFSDVHDDDTARQLFEAYLRINEAMLHNDELDLFPGVLDSLKRLKSAGVKQGIMTSKRRDSLMITLELKGMVPLFEQITALEDTVEHKPAAEPLIYSAAQMGISDMSRVLYVGDAIVDYECAINSGADFALVRWTRMDLAPFVAKGMPRVIGSIDELLQYE
ncbi:pyrophosphatase PpaX [Ruminococcaceae bacterium YRB3002]|nr:pyrophosphatase PpaX [Ruminococcaceae bacterium YRB3002]